MRVITDAWKTLLGLLEFWLPLPLVEVLLVVFLTGIKAEKEWYYVSQGRLSCEETNDLLYNMRKAINIMEKGFIGDGALPIKNKFIDRARKETERYFTQYLVGELQ